MTCTPPQSAVILYYIPIVHAYRLFVAVMACGAELSLNFLSIHQSCSGLLVVLQGLYAHTPRVFTAELLH